MKTSLISMVLLLCISAYNAQAATNPFLSSPDGDNDKAGKNKVETEANVKQTWEFYSTVKVPTTEELAVANNHNLGKEISCLYNSFMEIYVVKEEVVPGDPARRTIIRKPGIYNAVRSIEKQLSKAVKSTSITQEKAAEEFSNILKIALAAIDSDSQTFEEALQNSKKDTSRLLAIFDNVKLKSLY